MGKPRASTEKPDRPPPGHAFDPSLIYCDTAFAAALRVPDQSRRACTNELRRTGKLIVDGVNHPIATGADWLAAYVVACSK